MSRHTPEYLARITSDEWRELKRRIITERGRWCERCGTAGSIELHHLTYERLGQEWDEDLQLLCHACHKIADIERAEATRYQRGLATYARKKYGEDVDPEEVAEEFEEWLMDKEDY